MPLMCTLKVTFTFLILKLGCIRFRNEIRICGKSYPVFGDLQLGNFVIGMNIHVEVLDGVVNHMEKVTNEV